ncbi:MAG: bifunctional diaminohydroxyphosphoribosylaminopyrimidine deaminase/5-amino-6-(5-phosphoribosylamino)uracil reductase RibD [Planctomycetes bacterium]|nr:bifunctional diaminohydroxyphosphoribosylaminopyrimidine deaminase/5-amino-6-(5-phosphoribosylamino)uracil reductase RibD [Planctomycetota bacterium]
MLNDKEYMFLALDLARRGEGYVEPNPLVGAVIVKNNRIIGQGWHKYFGGPHAEINAINSVRDHQQLKGATMYLTLEPCTHFGKTPPCTPAVIQSDIKRVVIAIRDPNPLVRGKGIKLIRKSGIKVIEGVLAEEAKDINKPFFKLQQKGLPYVIAKWAMTADGKIATVTGDSKWISSPESRAFAHQLRSKVNGIMVGIHTVLKDDPMLVTWKGRQLNRIIIDSKGRIPLGSNIVRTAKSIPTYIATSKSAYWTKMEHLLKKGCIIVKTAGRHQVNIKELMKQLAAFGINKILAEGGGEIHSSLLTNNLVDEVYIFIAPKVIGGRDTRTPVEGRGIIKMSDALQIKDTTVSLIGGDVLLHGIL